MRQFVFGLLACVSWIIVGALNLYRGNVSIGVLFVAGGIYFGVMTFVKRKRRSGRQ